MPDRKKVLQALEVCASSGLFCAGEKCPYNSHALMCKYHLMRDALDLLRDTTNPKRGSCSTCIGVVGITETEMQKLREEDY